MSDNDLFTDVVGLTDENIAAIKGGKANVIVTIGVLGSSTAILNPPTAAAAIARYREITGDEPGEGDTVVIVGFDDAFQTYQLSAISN